MTEGNSKYILLFQDLTSDLRVGEIMLYSENLKRTTDHVMSIYMK